MNKSINNNKNKLEKADYTAELGANTFGSAWVKYRYFSYLQVKVQVQVLRGVKYIKYLFNQI